MPTECSAECFDFGIVDDGPVEAAFDGGLVTSDAGALLLGATDRAMCSAECFDFGIVDDRPVEAAFDGGLVTSDAGALLLGATDRAIGMIDRFARCFHDVRRANLIEHSVATLLGQRVFAIALGYEDLNDHDELRHDPMMAVLAGKLVARREDCAPVALWSASGPKRNGSSAFFRAQRDDEGAGCRCSAPEVAMGGIA
jgi:Transposase DDE domain group 1